VTADAKAHAQPLGIRPHLHQLAAAGATLGAALGLLAGIVELTVGPQIRPWVGDKLDTTRLGLATITLSLIALAAAITCLRRHPAGTGRNLVVFVGLLAPGLIGFTTVGRLWYAPGALLVLASAVIFNELRTEARDVGSTLSAHWLAGLTAVLAAFFILLGTTALGLAGALGILGGVAILATLVASGRLSHRIRLLVLCSAAVPFAALTWWSVVTPLLALLLILIGTLSVTRSAAA
jgi:hypothetical protein